MAVTKKKATKRKSKKDEIKELKEEIIEEREELIEDKEELLEELEKDVKEGDSFIAKLVIKHNGKFYKIGEKIVIKDQKQIDALKRVGAI